MSFAEKVIHEFAALFDNKEICEGCHQGYLKSHTGRPTISCMGLCTNTCLNYEGGNIPKYDVCEFLRYAYILRYFYTSKEKLKGHCSVIKEKFYQGSLRKIEFIVLEWEQVREHSKKHPNSWAVKYHFSQSYIAHGEEDMSDWCGESYPDNLRVKFKARTRCKSCQTIIFAGQVD